MQSYWVPYELLTVDEERRENKAIVKELSAEAMFQKKHPLKVLLTGYQDRLVFFPTRNKNLEVCYEFQAFPRK